MKTQLQLATFSVSVSGRIPDQVFSSYFPASVTGLGAAIANQVHEHVAAIGLGYYPAISYFRDNPGIVDDYLMDALDQVAEAAIQIVTDKTCQNLSPVFSQVKVLTQQNLVYGMPRVRPGVSGVQQSLIDQYTPNHVKLGLRLSLFQKTKPQPELASSVKKMVLRWLSDVFVDLVVSDSRLLTE